jgi:serine/threonine protein kinase
MSGADQEREPTQGEAGEPSSGTRKLEGVRVGGRWQLLAPIGAGGMGEVWRARHVELGRDAAVKLLTAPSSANRARILREARILASLRHPSIVEVFDIGEHEGVPYFVMGWVDGTTLARFVEQSGPLPPREAARAFIPLLDGLSSVHRAGIIHRDVKPDNVLVTRDADGTMRLVLIDFGIARLGGPDSKLTATGALVGTPEYMSPEVLRGGEADERTDVWGAAATLNEALTGVSPFRREHFVATVRAVTEDDPAPIASPTPRELALVVERGLAKPLASRHATAGAMRDAIDAFLSGALDAGERGLSRTQPAPRLEPPAATATPRTHSSADETAPPTSMDALIRERFGKA